MPKRDASLLIGDIQRSLDSVAAYIKGMDLTAFLQDRKTACDFRRIMKQSAWLTAKVKSDFTQLAA